MLGRFAACGGGGGALRLCDQAGSAGRARREVAQRHCSACHQVVPDQPSSIEAAAPSFMEIANLPGRSREYLRQFATRTHIVETLGQPGVPMPTIVLAPEEREDVVAYILVFSKDPSRQNLPPTKLEPFQ